MIQCLFQSIEQYIKAHFFSFSSRKTDKIKNYLTTAELKFHYGDGQFTNISRYELSASAPDLTTVVTTSYYHVQSHAQTLPNACVLKGYPGNTSPTVNRDWYLYATIYIYRDFQLSELSYLFEKC